MKRKPFESVFPDDISQNGLWAPSSFDTVDQISETILKKGWMHKQYIIEKKVEWRKKYYLMTRYKLYYTDVSYCSSESEKDDRLRGEMVLAWIHLRRDLEVDFRIPFQLMFWRKVSFCYLGIDHLEDYLSWFDLLSEICILIDLKSDYSIIDCIVKGKYSNIYRVHNIKDSCNYTLRVYEKKKLRGMNYPMVSSSYQAPAVKGSALSPDPEPS